MNNKLVLTLLIGILNITLESRDSRSHLDLAPLTREDRARQVSKYGGHMSPTFGKDEQRTDCDTKPKNTKYIYDNNKTSTNLN